MRGRSLTSYALGALGFAIVLIGWWVAADTFFAASGVVPSPIALGRQALDDGLDYYLRQIGVTLASAGQGYLWGVLIALALAAVVMLLPRLHTPVSQVALFIECAPAAAIGPVALAMATGRTPSVFLAGIAVLFTTLVGALLGARAARAGEIDIVRAHGGTRWDVFRKVRVFAALPATVAALTIGVPASILGAIIGEYLGGVDSGIGVALAVSQRSIQVERTWLFGLSAALVTSLGYALFSILGKRLLPWSARAGGSAPSAPRAALPLMLVRRIAAFVGVIVAIIVIWWILIVVSGVTPYVAKTPLDVFSHLFVGADAAENRAYIFEGLAVTVHDAGIGYLAGLGGATIVAVLFSLFPALATAFMPVAMVLRTFPLIALTPLIVLAFGRGDLGLAAIGFIVVFFAALVTISFGIASAPREAIDVVTVFGGGRWARMQKVGLPSALPALFTAARIAIPQALSAALIAEWLVTGSGAGAQLMRAAGTSQYTTLWSIAVVFILATAVVYLIVSTIEGPVLARFGGAH